jgi:hypothetical protein
MYVYADHAHDQVTRRSVTGILTLVSGMTICWYSKRQQTVESSSYWSKLVAARLATEQIIDIWCRLRMLGVPVTGPTVLLGDNRAVVLNTTVPSSMLKKKHHAIAYHKVRDSIAAGILHFHHIPTAENLADILTKPLGPTLFHRILHSVMTSPPPVSGQTSQPFQIPPPTSDSTPSDHTSDLLRPGTIVASSTPDTPFVAKSRIRFILLQRVSRCTPKASK